MMKYLYRNLLLVLLCVSLFSCQNSNTNKKTWLKDKLIFQDDGSEDWRQNWMLDGKLAKVINSKKGMELIAGNEFGNDTSHTVLWTKKSFKGNICIEYDYTRTDTSTRCVNILYFLATGKGDSIHSKDISLWNEQRMVPHMYTYFNNMNTYHISYAAFSAKQFSKDNDYIRLRRYKPNGNGLQGTQVPGEYLKTGLFKTNTTYRIEVYKFENKIKMHITNKSDKSDSLICNWDVSSFPDCTYGRIGLRHMYTRSARYANFKVWDIKGNSE